VLSTNRDTDAARKAPSTRRSVSRISLITIDQNWLGLEPATTATWRVDASSRDCLATPLQPDGERAACGYSPPGRVRGVQPLLRAAQQHPYEREHLRRAVASGEKIRDVLGPGGSRKQLARTLNAAYADGLLSEETFVRRLDQLLQACLIDPIVLTGDLTLRPRPGLSTRIELAARRAHRWAHLKGAKADDRATLLALDWTGSTEELLIGRSRSCDIVLASPEVSRRHARLFFRDGSWIVQDLTSTNGTSVNGAPVGRCQLRPGDRLDIANEQLHID
jgi:hypothetical protein